MKYRIGWESHGTWKYITVNTHAEALEELADKTMLSDKVSYRAIPDKKK
jgi:hypothetical protein